MFVDQLLSWYARHKRVLPWRTTVDRNTDPYHVLVSELMLQQTQVTVVIPYYLKFLRSFPTIHALAQSPIERVLTLWSGLGYYRRAHYLHQAAQQIVKLGGFPQSAEELLKLPGIGQYTAGAIASIAYNQPKVAIDGNVERVFGRIFALDFTNPQEKKLVRVYAERCLPTTRAKDYAESLMDMGALLCRPRLPLCNECFWNMHCYAYRNKDQLRYPIKKTKAAKVIRYTTTFVMVVDRLTILLQPRTEGTVLKDLYEFPSTVWGDRPIEKPFAFAPISANWKQLNRRIKHVFSHITLYVDVYYVFLDACAPLKSSLQPIQADALKDFPVSALTIKIWDEVSKAETRRLKILDFGF